MTVIQRTTNFAPNLAVFGIRNRTATVVSNTPEPSRNTGCDINPWTACDICVNRATDCGTPANLAKMAAYRRFTDTNSRMANSPNLLPIKSRLLDNLELANAPRMVASSNVCLVIRSPFLVTLRPTVSDFPFHFPRSLKTDPLVGREDRFRSLAY